jgi:hypothetical protein
LSYTQGESTLGLGAHLGVRCFPHRLHHHFVPSIVRG